MKRILLVHTGGTMGMAHAGDSGVVSTHFVDELFEHVPGIRDIAEIDFRIPFTLDSSNVSIHHWVELGELLADQMDRYDGFVVIHGTDTMSYTASALSFMLGNLAKPVILTGSQRPLSAIRTDAKNNLINAIELATYDIPEVCLFFDYKLYRGNRTKKISIDEFDAFVSPNFPILAEVGLHIDIKQNHRHPAGIFRLDTRFETGVFCFRLFPGFNPDFMDGVLTDSIKVVLIEAFGAGNIPSEQPTLVPFVRKLSDAGKLVAISSQSMRGTVDLHLYECGRQALEAGAISCGDMTTEASVIKAMYLLGQFSGNVDKVRKNFSLSLAGEITES